MKDALKTTAHRLRKAEQAAYIRRVMWLSFEERLNSVFSEIDSQGIDAEILGNLFISFSNLKNNSPESIQPFVYSYNSLNQAQISVGCRTMGIWHNLGNNQQLEPNLAMEKGATISFSQDITGRVMVLLYPYTSDLAKVHEDNFILYFGLDPNDLTEKVIRKIFKIFFRYCDATSMLSVGSYRHYIFRLCLELRDIRNRQIQKNVILRFIEKTLMMGLAVAGIWATLYTSTKWHVLF